MKNIILYFLLIFSINSCKKNVEEELNQLDSANNIHTKNSRVGGGLDSAEYYLNMDKPTRDAILFKKSGGILPSTKVIRTGDRKPTAEEQAQIAALAVTPTYPDYHCCNNICLTIPVDPYGFYLPFTDIWGNSIKYIGRYGSDPRQMYYVYIPSNANINSKIVVLIHGGGWITGPDPDQVNGWSSAFAPLDANGQTTTNKQNNNIVKNLLLQGYVVVAPLYRLVAYGNSDPDILATPITVLDQVNDIDAAITHIKANFPTCLWNRPLNANNIQVLGESAGANLALLFAYTKANTSYIKSVISVAGPSNLNQFADFIKSKNLIHPNLRINQGCGIPFSLENYNDFLNFPFFGSNVLTHLPFYAPMDPIADYGKMLITNVTNFGNMNCIITTLNLPFNSPHPDLNPVSPNLRKADYYNLAQSCVRQIITTPLNAPEFSAISPRFQLNNSRVIPTFIIHGTKDRIVPYIKATDGMETALTNIGGLIGIYTNPTYAPTTYSTTPKHLVKKYTNADHGVADFQDPNYANYTGPSQTQLDILNWLNGH